MSDNKKINSDVAEYQKDIEFDEKNLDNKNGNKIKTKESPTVFYKLQLNELKEHLEKEKQNTTAALDKWKRALADYQNLEKQTADRINTRVDKIILDFLTVYEDLIRAQSVLKLDGIDSIISNMEAILERYEVQPIEGEGMKFDPKLHEVVQEIEDNDHEEGTIVKEIAKGYIIRDKVMKYSKVCVTKKLIKK